MVFCQRAGLLLQTQHSALYPLLSLPFRICIPPIYRNVIYHLISSSGANLLSVYHSFLVRAPANFFSSCLSVPALFVILPLFLAQLHFLLCLSISHAQSFSISTSQMLPVVFCTIQVSAPYNTTLYTNYFSSFFLSSFSKGLQKMLLFLLKASFAIAILSFTSWQFRLLLILHPKYLKLSTCSMNSSLIRMSIYFGFLPITMVFILFIFIFIP